MKQKIMPPTIFMLFLLSSIGLGYFMPLMKIVALPFSLLGILLIIFGIIFNIWVDILFKKKNTTIKPYKMPSSLITEGPFKISRHPIYLGMTAILFGVAIIIGSASAFIFPIIFIIITESLFIKTEEKNLEKKFGYRYSEYKKKVRRWI